MRPSAKTEYACLAIIALAKYGPDGPPVRVRAIAEDSRVPESFLAQILLQLKAAGLVSSTRGASGGYRLARPAGSITLGEVLAAVEGPATPAPDARGMTAEMLTSVLEHLRDARRAVLDRTSIAQLADRSEPREWTI